MIKWDDPALSGLLAGSYLTLLTLLWGGLILSMKKWGERWRLHPRETQEPMPSLTVCVPARDEAANIGACIQAILALDYEDLELVLVDDRSIDGTAEVARAAAGDDPRFRIIEGTEPPKGWAGKPWACSRAAGEAGGDLLLFVDADVRVAPWIARATAGVLTDRKLALLSIYGDWDLRSFWERVVIPVVGWFIRGVIDLDAINDPSRREAFANGQFILVRRDVYERTGGHALVKGEVLEDVRLAQAIKARALPCGMYHAPGGFQVRLYESLGEIIDGYTKNLYEGMERNPMLAAGAILFIFVGTLLPFVLFPTLLGARLLLGWAIIGWRWIAWTGLLCVMILAFRARLERMDGRTMGHALGHPLGNLVLVWILFQAVFKVEVTWKGRRFVDGKASGTE